MGLYVMQNDEVVYRMLRLHGLRCAPSEVLMYRIDREARLLRHDDGRTWPVPDDWNLDTTDGALARRAAVQRGEVK